MADKRDSPALSVVAQYGGSVWWLSGILWDLLQGSVYSVGMYRFLIIKTHPQ